ncbi:hypothetical protein GCM10022223_12720 [Kineosporia mesophila]|uniref:Uncharacterized protein n=2 Tax=Kineosporia mesophila TaxID=566012 RepID=A0ABP6Z8N0_9ACTN|nr:hypothetical protein [Kineosporia mesophila]MCD5354992.1 hypothetical protein [Kineosporia mesophila]
MGMVLLALAGCGQVQENQARVKVEDTYAQASGVKLPLPTTMPGGYQLKRIWSVASIYDGNGDLQSIARSAEFTGPSGTVRVCTEIIDIPGDLCPDSNVGITRDDKKNGLRRTVYIDSPTPDTDVEAVWGNVKYSASPSDWGWLG